MPSRGTRQRLPEALLSGRHTRQACQREGGDDGENDEAACALVEVAVRAELGDAVVLDAPKAAIVDDPRLLREASGIILPGVGAFADGIAKLRTGGFVEPLVKELPKP